MSKTSEQSIAPIVELRNAGFPRLHIESLAKRHLEGLKKLPEDTPEKQECILEVEKFLEQLCQT